MATIIEAKGLTKIYETGEIKVDALRGVDLQITKGEVVAIMGPSGCGKTTLLNTLSGLDDITGGQVLIDGEDIYKLKDNARTDFRARNMGFVFQFYNLLPVLTAVENVELPLLLIGVGQTEARQRASAMLDQVGILAWASHMPSQLSGGQRQRVTIARSLINSPAIVWADEPTGDLDATTSGEIIDLFLALNQKLGQTFVLVTHDATVASRTQRLIKMFDGRIVSDEKVV